MAAPTVRMQGAMDSVLLHLWRLVWRHRGCTSATLSLLLAKIAAVLVPLALKAIVDEFSADQAATAAPAMFTRRREQRQRTVNEIDSRTQGVQVDSLLNAEHATPEGGRVEIRLERHDVNARVSITDGRKAATPQANAATEPPGGVAPVDPLAMRSIVERQGGRFEVELATSQHGMRWAINLPLRALAVPTPEVLAATAPAPPLQPPQLSGVTVMCIDDHADALDSLSLMLSVEGARVLPFQNGAAALSWLQQHPGEQWPRLLVCDISLGDQEDGHQVVRRVRQLEAQRGVPLDCRMPAIALTGHAQPDDRLAALMAGFQLHLAKPVDGSVLTRALAALVGPPA